MSKRALTPSAAGKILELREELNEWGEHIYTGDEIAELLGVSPSTVWRVIHKQAAYARVKAAPTQAQMQASMERTLAILTAAPTASNPEAQASIERLKRSIEQQQGELEDPTKRIDALVKDLPPAVAGKARGLL